MTPLIRTVVRVLLLACISLPVAAPLAHASEAPLFADFDGDGQHDQVIVDAGRPTVLHVLLSHSATLETVRVRGPLVRLMALDLDGDRRAELIASDVAHGLHIWTKKQGKRFHAYAPRRALVEETIGRPGHRAASDRSSQPMADASAAGPLAGELQLAAHPTPCHRVARRRVAAPSPAAQSSHPLGRFAPRPPPFRSI